MGQTSFPPASSTLKYTTVPPTGASQSVWEGALVTAGSATNTITGTGSGLIAYASASNTAVSANGTITYLLANTPTVIPVTNASTSVTITAPTSIPNTNASKTLDGAVLTGQSPSLATNGSGTWVASGYKGGNAGQIQTIYSTNNGTSWTSITIPASFAADGFLIKYGNGYFVGIESNGYSGTAGGSIVYSTNGYTWTSSSNALAGYAGINISKDSIATNGSGTWIAVSQYLGSGSNGNAVISTNNGVTWSTIGAPFLSTGTGQYNFNVVIWTGSRWIARQQSGNYYSSTTGAAGTWFSNGAFYTGGVNNWAQGNGIFLGAAGLYFASTSDGFGSINGTYSTNPIYDSNSSSSFYVIFINNIWFAFQYGNNVNTYAPINPNLYSANNGITWTQYTGPLSNNNANGTYFAAASPGNNSFGEVASQGTGAAGVAITTLSSLLPVAFGLYQPSTQLH